MFSESYSKLIETELHQNANLRETRDCTKTVPSSQNSDQKECVQVFIHKTSSKEICWTTWDLRNAHEKDWLIWVCCLQHVKGRKKENYLFTFYLLLVVQLLSHI